MVKKLCGEAFSTDSTLKCHLQPFTGADPIWDDDYFKTLNKWVSRSLFHNSLMMTEEASSSWRS